MLGKIAAGAGFLGSLGSSAASVGRAAATGLGAVGLAAPIGEVVVSPLAGGTAELLTKRGRDAAIEYDFAQAMSRQRMQARVKILREKMRQTEDLLRRSDPQLYNEVMAGQRLPPDAIIIGGTPRRDLMAQLTGAIVTNDLPEEQF